MENEEVPENIQKFFQERAQLQALRRKLRQENLKAKENYSSLKLDQRVLRVQQVQKFLNKLKACKPMDRDQILNEIDNFNLQNYLSEISISIADQNITDAEVLYFVQVCSKLHQSYEDFQIQMVIQIQKQIKSGTFQKLRKIQIYFPNDRQSLNQIFKQYRIPSKEKDEKMIVTKRRDMLRFLTELFVVGFSIQPDKIFDCLKELIMQKDSRSLLQNVTTALMFSDRFGFEVLRCKGTRISRLYNKYDDLSNIFDFDQIVTSEKIQKMILQFQLYINSLIDCLKNLHDVNQFSYQNRIIPIIQQQFKVQQDEKINKLIKEESLTEKDEEVYSKTRNNYMQLLEAITCLSDNLELQFEVNFGEEEREKRQQQIIDDQRKKKQEEQERLRQESENLFDTDEERAFYEDLFDLKIKLPAQLFSNNYFQGNMPKQTPNNDNEDDTDQPDEPDKEQEEEEEDEKKEDDDEDKYNSGYQTF